MAGQRVSDFSISDPNGEALILSSQKSYRGHIELTLTNMGNTSAPQIAAGSVVEVGGSLYEFPSAESITGSPSDGTVYVKLIPNGASTTAEYTNTAPTWSDAKQGWYGTGATAGHRYVGRLVLLTGAYNLKTILSSQTEQHGDITGGVSALVQVTSANVAFYTDMPGGFSYDLYVRAGEVYFITGALTMGIVGSQVTIMGWRLYSGSSTCTFVTSQDFTDSVGTITKTLGGTAGYTVKNGLYITGDGVLSFREQYGMTISGPSAQGNWSNRTFSVRH